MVIARRSPTEGGFTVIELMVSSALLLIGLAMFGSVLFTVQKVSARQSDLSEANDGARLAFQEIDNQLRSGFVAHDGAVPVFDPADAEVRLYSEARAGGSARCIAWVLYGADDGPQALWTRSWNLGEPVPEFPPEDPRIAGWRMVVGDITNSAHDADGAAFVVEGADVFDAVAAEDIPIGQRLTVTLWFNPSGIDDDRAIELTTTVTSRNAPRAVTWVPNPHDHPADPDDDLVPIYDLCG